MPPTDPEADTASRPSRPIYFSGWNVLLFRFRFENDLRMNHPHLNQCVQWGWPFVSLKVPSGSRRRTLGKVCCLRTVELHVYVSCSASILQLA